jgi:hypothetical protein
LNRAALLARAAAFGFFINLVLHTSAVGPVSRMAAQASREFGAVVPVLWLGFSGALFIFGVIVLLHAHPAAPQRKPVLILAGLFPLGTAIGQYFALGWIFPEATLGLTGLLAIAAGLAAPAASTAPA